MGIAIAGDGGTIEATPSSLQNGSSAASANAGASNDLTDTMMSAFNDFLNLLGPIAGAPIVGPGATALMEAVDNAGAGFQTSMQCFGTGLNIMAPGMTQMAQSFIATDSSLASTFHELESLMPQFEHYATSIKLTTPTVTEVGTLNQFLAAAKTGKPFATQAALASVQFNVPSPHRSFWGNIGHGLAVAWNDTGGKAVTWVNQHKWAVLGGIGAAVVIVGGFIVNIPDGETLEPAAIAGGAAIEDLGVSADAAATTTDAAASSTAAAASATGAASDSLAVGTATSLSPGELATLDQMEAMLKDGVLAQEPVYGGANPALVGH